jgi:hypothetical protein
MRGEKFHFRLSFAGKSQPMNTLTHPDDKKVKDALNRARESGDAQWIRPLASAFAARPEDAIREEMADLLGTLKVSAAEGELLAMLDEPEFEHVKADLLCFLWSCGFTCPGRLAKVTRVACEGDFRQAMEGSTLVEQVESTEHEQDVLEALVVVREALADSGKADIHPLLRPLHDHLAMLNNTMM